MKTRALAGTRPARGVSSLLMLALLVTLALLAVHATGLVTAALGDASRATAQGRVAQAADAGLEWGRWRITVPAAPLCAALTTINTLPGTLQPYVVTVRCSAGPAITDGAAVLRRYQLDAVACNIPAAGACPNPATDSPDYVQRSLSWVVHR